MAKTILGDLDAVALEKDRHLATARAKILHALEELDIASELGDIPPAEHYDARMNLEAAHKQLGQAGVPRRRRAGGVGRRVKLRDLLERDDLTRAELLDATHKLYEED